MVPIALTKVRVIWVSFQIQKYNYQISPRYLFQNNFSQIELDNIIGIDLIYANYYSDRMQLDGRQYYTNLKMIDKTCFIF